MSRRSPLSGRKVLITSGATRERLDPVRFLTNASSGRMGFALARAARALGARVVVVSGPTALRAPRGIEVRGVESAREMLREAQRAYPYADVVIGAAAVSDWRFAEASSSKIKRSKASLRVTLVPNPDIIASLSARRRRSRAARGKLMVGFALETERWLERAREKLERKGLDMVVANGVESLGGESSRIALVEPGAPPRVLPTLSKAASARAIMRRVAELARARREAR